MRLRLRAYKRPLLPPSGVPWHLLNPDGFVDGPFYTEAVTETTLPGRPWGIMGGSPRILRLRRQRGNVLYMEDGEFQVILSPDAAALPGTEHFPRVAV